MDDRAHRGLIAVDKEAWRLQLDEERLGAEELSGRLPNAAVTCDRAHIRLPGGEVLRQHHFELRSAILVRDGLPLEEGGILKILADSDNPEAFLAAPAAHPSTLRNALPVLSVKVFRVEHDPQRRADAECLIVIERVEDALRIGG